jgi:hypothetical protein
VLPETFPGIEFDAAGVCSICRADATGSGAVRNGTERARQRFMELVDEVSARPGYHCLLAFSGGKDSTYTLHLLRKIYKLRVLAVTFDNGFLSPQAFTNMRKVLERIDADHLLVKPRYELLRKLFAAVAQTHPFPPKVLERASSVCNACIGLVKNICLRTAIEQQIPLIVYGWSPGQAPVSAAVFQFNRLMLRQMQKARMTPLQQIACDNLKPYMLTETHLEEAGTLPYSVNPLAFESYDKESIIETIRSYGWEQPSDTDGNSTNCLLNSIAIRLHLRDYGFHPYAAEVAHLVRTGAITREQGLAELEDLGSEQIAHDVAEALGIKSWQCGDTCCRPPG